MDESTASVAAYSDDIRPYKIHVSSKYLALTKRKLELTRLPHEILLPRSREWENGTPKSDIEPLIDFWLEEYNWRRREEFFNATPQYRTAITPPGQEPLRLHFIHVKSSQLNAIPLLLIPSFPFTNLYLVPLLKELTEPESGQQAFHVVCPSLPGIGFSDAHTFTSLHENGEDGPGQITVLNSTTQLFNSLMQKLDYERYLASSTGSGTASPAHIDYEIPRLLASNHCDNCVGIHIFDPPSSQPVLTREPWNWTKYAIAKFFHAPIFGYAKEDWKALTGAFSAPPTPPHPSADEDLEAQTEPQLVTATSASSKTNAKPGSRASRLGLGLSPSLLLTQPNTLSYALCDSPVGLLSLVLASLRHLSPTHDLSPTDIIDVTQMAWLPGPEAAMRFWGAAAQENVTPLQRKSRRSRTATAVTTFLGVEEGKMAYRPPGWARARHNVVVACRREGRAGLVVCERGNAVVEGIRALAGKVVKKFPALMEPEDEIAAQIQIEMVGTDVEEMGDERDETDVQQMEVESPDTIIMAREL